MLKLMKYEMTHSMRTFMTSFLVYLVGCAIIPFAMHFLSGSAIGEMFLGVILFIFVMVLIGIMLALFVSVFMNFNRSMFDKPGYLTLTLPKSNLEILISKLIISLLWIFVGFIVVFLGIVLMVSIVGFMEGVTSVGDFFKIMGFILKQIPSQLPQYLTIFLQIIAELGFMVSTIYFAITITHTKWIRKYRMPIAIVIFFAVNMLIGMGVTNINIGENSSYLISLSGDVYSMVTILLNVVMSAGFIFLTTYVLDKHIEVE